MGNSNRKISIFFPDFDTEMYFTMDERNKELCNEVWEALPFSFVLEHSMVSGCSVYGWVPLVSLAEIPVKILRTESPIGWVGFNQGTGNKISIKYGDISEDLYGNSLGFIPEKFHDKLKAIGYAVWTNYFNEKRIYLIEMKKIMVIKNKHTI